MSKHDLRPQRRRGRASKDREPAPAPTYLAAGTSATTSPRNIPGVPPGPIASPGRAAIQAAVRPAHVNYLYFVAMDDRHHQFSTNLADHNAAVARYRLARSR